MHLLRTILPALVYPILLILVIGILSTIIAPGLWNAMDGKYALEKIFQKTGLVILLLTAILATRTTAFISPFNISRLAFTSQLRQVVSGWLIGIIIMSVPLCLLVILKIRILDPAFLTSFTNITGNLASALCIGLVVGLVEEYIFRGWLMDWLFLRLDKIQLLGPSLAVIISSFFYATLHFLRSAPVSNADNGTISAGLDVFLRSLIHVFQHNQTDTLIALFLAGIFLGLIKTFYYKGLMTVVGIHAGWIFCIKLSKTMTNSNPANEWPNLIGQDGILGSLSATWLGLLILWLIVNRNLRQAKLR